MSSAKSELSRAQIITIRIWAGVGLIVVLAFGLGLWSASVDRASIARVNAAVPKAKQILRSDERFREVEVEVAYRDGQCLLFFGHVYSAVEEELLSLRVSKELNHIDVSFEFFYRRDQAPFVTSGPASLPLQ